MGVAWIMPEEVEDIMTDVQLSPSLAAVPKKNPETLLFTGDWRIIHDHNKGGSEPINNRTERTPGKRHPPTVFPQHHEVALLIVWMAVVLPRLRIAAGKLGTFMAFRNRLIRLVDANFSATQFPGWRRGRGLVRLTVVCGAPTFRVDSEPVRVRRLLANRKHGNKNHTSVLEIYPNIVDAIEDIVAKKGCRRVCAQRQPSADSEHQSEIGERQRM